MAAVEGDTAVPTKTGTSVGVGVEVTVAVGVGVWLGGGEVGLETAVGHHCLQHVLEKAQHAAAGNVDGLKQLLRVDESGWIGVKFEDGIQFTFHAGILAWRDVIE